MTPEEFILLTSYNSNSKHKFFIIQNITFPVISVLVAPYCTDASLLWAKKDKVIGLMALHPALILSSSGWSGKTCSTTVPLALVLEPTARRLSNIGEQQTFTWCLC